ncbi:ATP-binding protein [Micromonospora sp. NPDC049497]|uniref:ATP-binding protein n=1 Tax=Micromonospora sp. NPDC049497 TaxID=3364273 RepID=UPI0037B8D509
MAESPLDHLLPTAAEPFLSTSLTLPDLTRVRREVRAVSHRCGLDDDQIEDWISAVNELMINVIRHGGGRGTVRLLLLNGRFTCEVTDYGPGFNNAHYVPRTERPSLSETGGMGLWVVGQMADFLLIDSGPAGTTIRITPRPKDTAG